MLCGKQISTAPAPRTVGLLTSQKKPRCVPTLRRTADVRRGSCVDGALGVLGQGVLPRPVEVVHLVLHEATDLLVLKAAGVICGEGKGLVSCGFSNLLPKAAWVLAASCTALLRHHCGSASSWGCPSDGQPLRPQEEAEKEYICD